MPSEASVWYSLTSRAEMRSSAFPPAGILMIESSGCEKWPSPSVYWVCNAPAVTVSG